MKLWLVLALTSGMWATTVRDTVYDAVGRKRSGRAVISWPAFTAPDGRAIPAGRLSAAVSAGALAVNLEPSEEAGISYQVRYYWNDGSEGLEYWAIPQSDTPVTLEMIRLPSPVPRFIRVAPYYVDGELPTGEIDGVNRSFILAHTPSPQESITLYRNGLLQKRGTSGDYTVSGNTITFNDGLAPQVQDILQASYRWRSGWGSVGSGESTVSTVFGRSGDVVAMEGDYSAGQITGLGDSATKDVGTGSDDVAAGDHEHAIADVTNLQTSLDGKAASSHGHIIGDTTGLQTALDGKSATGHGHAIGDTTGLQTALDGKAASSHGHIIGDTTGLQTALDGKSATGHGHAIGDTTGLQTALDGKAASSHAHIIGDTTGLQTALDGKSATGHGHAINDTTGLQTALDGKFDKGSDNDIGTHHVDVGTKAAPANPSSGKIRVYADSSTGKLACLDSSGSSCMPAGSGSASWGSIMGTLSNQTDLQTALDGKSATGHGHAIADVTNLQTSLDGKAASSHGHIIGDTTGLQTALDGKSATGHGHAIGDTTGLQTALDGKAASSHAHIIGDTTGLQTALDGKSATGHGHAIGDTTGLQTALDGKAASSHAHIIGDTTGLQTALDGKSATGHGHAISDTTGLQTALDGKFDKGSDNDIGTHHVDVGTKAAPANPSSGKIRVYGDSSTGKLACLDSSGGSCMPAGSGSSDAITYQTFLAGTCQAGGAATGFALPASNAPTANCTAGANAGDPPTAASAWNYAGLLFAENASAATAQSIQLQMVLPPYWKSAAGLDLDIKWRTAATSGDVVWQIQGQCVAAGETTGNFGSAVSVTADGAQATAWLLNDTQTKNLTTSDVLAGCAENEILFLRFFRDAQHASDSLASSAELISLRFKTTRTQ